MGERRSTQRRVPWGQTPGRDAAPAPTAEQTAAPSKARSLLRKIGVWPLVLVVGAAGGALTDWMQPRFSDALNVLTETGDPVRVMTTLRPRLGDMWLPAPAFLPPEHVEELRFTEPRGQAIELQKHGAVMFGDRVVELVLTGNRTGGVRITDLRPISDCSDFGAGTLLMLIPHGGGAPPTHRMMVNVEDADQAPLLYDASQPGQPPTPFFDEKTITLDKNEEEFVLLDLQTDTQHCSFDLELTILDGQEQHTQRVFGEGNELSIAPQVWWQVEEDMEIGAAYVGGEVCDGFRPVEPDEDGRFNVDRCPAPFPG